MSLIYLTDYNIVQSTIQSVLGTGAGDFGYGQSLSSSQLATGSQITALQWINLRTDILKARQHQTGNDESGNIVLPVAGSAVSGSIYDACSTLASTVVSNRMVTPPAGQATLETITSTTRTNAWNGTISTVISITWPDANAARHYFNSGSNIQFTASRSGGNTGSKNNTWTTMLSTMGTITFSYTQTVPSGSGTGSGYGWSNLPGTNTQIFWKPAPAGVYAENDFYIYGRKISSNELEFTFQFLDDDAGDHDPGLDVGLGPFGVAVDENVDGSLTATVQAYRASGTNVSVPAPPASASQL
jgi:hypothetical protein